MNMQTLEVLCRECIKPLKRLVLKELEGTVKSINGQSPDENGNVNVEAIVPAADATDAIETLAECGILTPAYQDGVFYTDADGAIYVL